jgi:hypothetical protein
MVASLGPCEMQSLTDAVLTRQPCCPDFCISGVSSFASHSLEWFAFLKHLH